MKRGESGLSLLVAIDKPSGMSSHDVVNRVRRIFGERRVGHTGTLDPLATGVLPVCIGPATRLDRFMTGHDKRYRVTVAFGLETTTDDAEGEPTCVGQPPSWLFDEERAAAYVASLVGEHMQTPPQYSAIKIDGKRAYELARSGNEAKLEPRPIQVYESSLAALQIDAETGHLLWAVDFSVSKGTYIRSLARDIGRDVGCPAHVQALQRRSAGLITLDDCVSLETLEARGIDAALDPVAVLGYRYAFADEHDRLVLCGAKLPAGAVTLCEPLRLDCETDMCACAGSVVKSAYAPKPQELVAIVVENRLKAIYSYSEGESAYRATCVFSTGILRM